MGRLLAVVVVLGAVLTASWFFFLRGLPDDVIARINGVDVPVRSVDVLVAYAQRREPSIDRKRLLSGVVESQLLAEYAADHHDEHHTGGSGQVDYSEETLYENELFRILRVALTEEISAAAKMSGSGDPMDFLSEPLVLDPDALAPLLSLDSLLYLHMSEEQEAASRQFVLARYQFPGGPLQDLTLWDLYSRQNIQLKVQMHEMNLDFMREATRQFLATQFVLDWFRRSSPFTPDERAAVERMVADRMTKEELLHDMGLMHDIHDDNPALRAIMEEITSDEIKAYYDANKDEFTRVEKVRARHIRVDSQEAADALYAQLKAGELTFEEAIATHSTDPDRNSESPGDLGWIDRDARHSHWLRGIAFVQPEGAVSPPFRSPQNEGEVYWEIVTLDEKVMGYQPWDSEGVRYEASKAIGKQKLQERFTVLKTRLLEEADIEVNEALLVRRDA